ncbi:MAG: hypothetical protein HOD43_09975 [Candidatus Marinimicrobia bacterium]|jgi:hypothetical protein|nr:hypothetical protein [Candidatus Neomarinimicrobiota bacterium]MBT3824725.1 hypothetical protein [Candidatus Neomarinimicrobiota bacterium]MBT4131649.1 hypothetical protein [Candidatus Neomarinimicrobiota bacterium]MBT4296118.1 hypothetical protein [Candidatus Neomarinimicrobiota bacterium]MBT4418793.1 hypothetical protein [Candidatus Neomarinimicrobiota bacterium]
MKYPAFKHIITGGIITSLMLISQVFALPDTNKEVLSQKILLENTIHQRVSDAVYRILRHENFIVNVNVVMEATPTQEYTTVYEAPGSKKGKISPEQEIFKQSLSKTPGLSQSSTSSTENTGVKKTRTILKKRPIETNVPSDIPGFPGIQSPGFELYEEEVPVEEDTNEDVVYAAAEDLDEIAEIPDTTQSEVAAEASLSLEENEVILEEDLQSVSENTDDQYLVNYSESSNPQLSRHTVASISGPSLRVNKMELTVILEDPISPQIIENIRTVTMVASHFNRERGDKLQVMTADFQGATNDKPDTEQLLLKSIAEKMTAIEARQKEETENKRIKDLEAQQEQMKLDQANTVARDAEMARIRQEEADKQREHEAELARLRQEEEDRITLRENELRDLREQEENRLAEERRQLFEAQQAQAQDRLRQDSLRLALLSEQLDDLKDQLSAVDLEEEQRLKLELEQKRREAEKSAIKDREDRLKQQMNDLENQRLQATMIPDDEDDLLWLFIIGAAVLVGLAVIIGALMGGRRQAPDLPPSQDIGLADVEPEPSPEVEAEPEEDVIPQPEIDPELVDEVDSIKKSVVSLAVSKPGSASSIVKEWLQDTGEAEEEEESEGEEEEKSNGKKKKKGQK